MQSLANDTVFIQKIDGSQSGPHKAVVTSGSIVIFDETVNVVDGDHVSRKLANGNEELYLVTSADFHQGLHSIPANFQLKVRRTTALPRTPEKPVQNFHFNNSSGIQIGDHNTQQIQVAIQDLAQKIDNSDAPPEQKQEAKSRLADFLKHPATVAVLGAAATAIAAKLLGQSLP